MADLPQGFTLDPSPPQASTELPQGFTVDNQAPVGGGSPDLPEGFQLDDEKYGSTGQQVIAGIEGAAQGIAGPAATLAETKLLGVKPEDIRGRAEANPWTHGLSEAGGFAGSLLTGTGEAALLGKAGELAAHAAGLGETATTGAKLARGAVTAATEMGLYQAGDETSKWILNAPQTPGSIAANIGLSALLGGVAGPAFAGLGIAATKALDSTGLKEFADRLAFRRANIDPNEMMRNEAENVVNTYNDMNGELSGPNGLKAQALQKILPKEMTPEISNQVQSIAQKSTEIIENLRKQGAPERFLTKLTDDANNFWNKSLKDPYETFDALNGFKKDLQDYSKGNWGPFAVPRYHEAFDFINATKDLSREVRLGLENPNVWGKAADLQKDLNASWSKALPAAKDFEKKFMTKVGDQAVVSSDKFNTYSRQGLKATTTTDRQKMMGNFIDAMDNHFGTVDKIYQAAGVDNPYPAVGMGMLKESVEKQSLGVRLADVWHDKVSAHALGNTLGAGLGGTAGGTIGHGLEGAYLGREILGPMFSTMLKPILEKYPNVDIGALQQAMSIAKNIQKGNNNLANAAGSLFGSAKTFPSHVIPSATDLEKLDEKTKNTTDASQLMKVPGNSGYYLPNHDTAMSKAAGDAVTYINAQRPAPQKALPLDAQPKATIAQKEDFKRTLAVAQQPLMAIKHIKDGTITPQDVQTVKTIYPDYYAKMSQEIMKSLNDHINEGGQSLPYSVKQGMSLFLGQPIDSTMTPSSVMAAQMVYAKQAANKAAAIAAAPKKNASKMAKISDNYLTQNDGSIKRRNMA